MVFRLPIERFKAARRHALLHALAIATGFESSRAADWPQALGPDRNGVVRTETIIPPTGDQKPKVRWQTNVGHGVSPVVVSKGRVYAYGVFKPHTGADKLGDPATTPTHDEVRQVTQGTNAVVRSRDVPGTPSWVEDEHGVFRGDGYALCLDAATGRVLWATKLTDWGLVLWGNWRATERSSPAVADGRSNW
jgi:hypothetical protein